MESELLIVRHGLDDDGITNPIDGLAGVEPSLTPEGIIGVNKTALDLASKMKSSELNGVNIYSGSKIRAIQTASILQTYISRSSIDSNLLVRDTLDNPIYGDLINIGPLNHEQNVAKFRLAWRAFDSAWKVERNLDYRFGEPIHGDSNYANLDDFIESPYGESQRQIYIRIYGTLRDIMNNTKDGNHSPIIVTHKTIAREIQTFIAAQNEDIPVEEYPLSRPLVHAEVGYSRVLNVDFCISALTDSLKKLERVE